MKSELTTFLHKIYIGFLLILSSAACIDRKPKAPPTLEPEPSVQDQSLEEAPSTPALPEPPGLQDDLQRFPEGASEGSPAKVPLPSPTPAPTPAPKPSPTPAPKQTPELTVNQWDGKTDQAGPLWMLEAIP